MTNVRSNNARPKRFRRLATGFIAAALLFLAASAYLSNVFPLPLRSIIAMVQGAGELGVLADGSGRTQVELEDGTLVPTVIGTVNRAGNPLPKLPMPDHPFLRDETASGGVHSDAYNSAVISLPGPRGIAPLATYREVLPGDELAMCVPMLQMPNGHLASTCVGMGRSTQLVLFDANDDFKIIARTETADEALGFMQAGQGWYAALDHKGRVNVLAPNLIFKVYALDERGENPEWRVDATHDLGAALEPKELVFDIRPDFENNLWFSSGYGYVGYIDASSDDIERIKLPNGERSGTALSITRGGVFMLTSKALYRLERAEGGGVITRWRYAYGESNSENGDLTAPTLIDEGRLIAFGLNDDASPHGRVVVVRTDAANMSDEERVICKHRVFKADKSFLDNSFTGYGKSLVVQNNYGGIFFDLVEYEPGTARVDVREDYSGCDTIWEDYTISSQVPPRLSTADAFIYQYARRMGTDKNTHAWYLSTLEYETGKPVYDLFIGSGKRLDNPMLSVDMMPGRVMVAGVRNGIVVLRDGVSQAVNDQ